MVKTKYFYILGNYNYEQNTSNTVDSIINYSALPSPSARASRSPTASGTNLA